MKRIAWRELDGASLISAGLWLLCALAALLLANSLMAWGQLKLDDLRYGRPRLHATSFDLGPPEQPGRPTVFIAINADRRVVVFQVDNNDAAQSKALVGPYLFGTNADLVPVLLSHADATGDGLEDLLVNVDGEVIVYVNDGGVLRLASPDEQEAFAGLAP